jgi:hypothetical protein
VIWAPDGSRVHAVYSCEYAADSAEAVATFSNDQGSTWSSPMITARFPSSGEKPFLRLGTPLRATGKSWVYLVAKQYPFVFFSRSGDSGKTWYPPQQLISCGGRDEDVSAPSLAGGPGGEVLVAWGFRWCGGSADERTEVRRSTNFGKTFSPAVVAVPDIVGITSIAFGTRGTAHLIYVPDNFGSGTDGPFYVYSTKSPHAQWSKPILLNDAVSVGGTHSPALTVSACGSNTSVLHAVWLDDRVGLENYNVYYSRKIARTGQPWSPNLRVSTTSLSASYDYSPTATIAAGVGAALSLWGGRQASWINTPRPIWASRIAPGVSCP